MAFLQYPDLPAKTREIIMVNGTVGAGLATPFAAPDALWWTLPRRLGHVSHGRTRQGCLRARSPSLHFVGRIWQPYLDFRGEGGAGWRGRLRCSRRRDRHRCCHRVVKPIHVDIETNGEFSYGATVTNQSLTSAKFEQRGDRLVLAGFPPVPPNVAYPEVVDGDRFVRLFMDRLMQAPASAR